MPTPDAQNHLRHRPITRGIGLALLFTVLLLGAAWTMTALWYQASLSWRLPLMIATALGALVLMGLGLGRPTLAWAGSAGTALVIGLWWGSIHPSNTRDWAPELARTATAEIQGDTVTVRNVRNFEWRTEDDFTPRWETRTYDLKALKSVDLFSSVWASPAIAHTLIGFGFDNGDHLVFSVEIRREKNEAFSEIGGFFKQFELSLIAADENDIIRLRTDARGETVSLFPLEVSPEQARALFLSYLNRANRLAEKPEFYQTVTTNCTTVIFHLARIVAPGIPFDWRILVSGYLPDYLYDLGLIRRDIPLEEVRRNAVIPAQKGDPRPFSQAIRAPRGASSADLPPPPGP